MKVTVIGAGPAGLYFAAYLKQKNSAATITLFEKRKKGAQDGLGYTLQHPTAQDLSYLDVDVCNNLGKDATSPWATADIEAKDGGITIGFPISVGIRRAKLLSFLESIVTSAGIPIMYDVSLSKDQLAVIKEECDVIVGADGLHSIVRNTYHDKFSAYALTHKNSFAWLQGYRHQDNIHMLITKLDGLSHIVASYPIDDNTISVVIDRPLTDQHGKRVPFVKNYDWGKLSRKLSTPFHTTDLPNQLLRWYSNTLNGCKRFSFDNVALIGESAVSCYYMSGAGLSVAFYAARVLADALLGFGDIARGLDAYSMVMINRQKAIHGASLAKTRWMEQSDIFYNTLDSRPLMDSFRMVGREYNKTK